MPSDLPTLPVRLRVHLAHATVEAIAAEAGADVLHIKGPACDPALRPVGRASVDADVLVRPSHLNRLRAGLSRHGWQQVTPLQGGGLVHHSTNWYHGELGQLDVHVRFPGIQIAPADAFEVLWRDRGLQQIAHRQCTVPSVTAQRLIVLLHAARNMPGRADEVRLAWTQAPPEAKADVRALVGELDADVAFSVTTGNLEDYRDRPEYQLWRLYSGGDPGANWFLAGVRASPAGFQRIRLTFLRHLLGVAANIPKRIEIKLGRKPTPADMARGYGYYLKRGLGLGWLLIAEHLPAAWRAGARPTPDAGSPAYWPGSSRTGSWRSRSRRWLNRDPSGAPG